MDLVDNVDSSAAVSGQVADVLTEGADIVDPGVGGSVDFEHIEGVAAGDLHAGRARAAGGGRGALGAVDRASENPGGTRFTGTPRSTKQVAGANPVIGNGVDEGPGHMLLSDNVLELLRTVFAGEYQVTHTVEYREKSAWAES